MRRPSGWECSPGWWWRAPALALLLVGVGVVMKFAGLAVADAWHVAVGRLR